MRVIDQITKPSKQPHASSEPVKDGFIGVMQKRVENIELKKIKKRITKKMEIVNIGLSIFAVSFLAVLLLGYRLFSLPSSMPHAQEIATYQQSSSVRTIIDSGPTHLMPKLANLSLHAFTDNPLAGRVTSALIGFIAVISFFLVCRSLFGERLSVVVTILFMTTTMFLSLTRSGEPYSNFLSLFIALSFAFLVLKKSQADWLLMPFSLLLLWLITTPGGIFVVLPLMAIKTRWLVQKIKESSKSSIIISGLIIVSGATILIYSGLEAVNTKQMLKELIGVPAQLNYGQVLKNLYYLPKAIFYQLYPGNWNYWLNGQPILDILSSFLFLFGTYHIVKSPKLERFSIALTVFAAISVWIAFSDNLLNSIALLPFIYLVIGFGLQAIVFEWRTVFPKNTLVRHVGLGIIGIVLFSSIWFQAFRYFIVQPKTPEVKKSYNISTTQ